MSNPFDALAVEIDQALSDAVREHDLAERIALVEQIAGRLEAEDDPALHALAAQARRILDLAEDEVPTAWARLEAAWNGWKAAQIAADWGARPEESSVSIEDMLAALDTTISVPTSAPRDGEREISSELIDALRLTFDGSDPEADSAAGSLAPGLQAPVFAAAPAADDDLSMLAADPELAAMFVAEALDHLSSIEALVLKLEAEPDDQRLLNDVFRPFHTIKGNAGALGVTRVQECAHKIENLLDLGRSGTYAIGAAAIEIILRGVDVLSTMIGAIPARMAGGAAPDVEAARLAVMAAVDRLIDGDPRAPAARATDDRLFAAGEPQPAGEPGSVERVARAEAPTLSLAAPASVGQAPVRPREDHAVQTSVKVDTRKLDNLVDIVGELVIAQSMIQLDRSLQQVQDERLSRNLAQLKRITTELQRTAMSMRMTPVRPIFQKMSRLVRDLAKRSGKQIELALAGEDTELDRKVVEEINDPLMHMVRNSVDHGIEPAEVRAAAGKPAVARVSLSAYHEGGTIVIAIGDDGGGLDTEKIRAKAVAQRLIAADAPLAACDIHQLIFMPGFSTAERITEISGRGVGMDVVRRNIEALRGRIEIQTAPGAGTTFLIRLPLTLAILEGLLLRSGQTRFVLPTFSIRESLRPTPEQVHSIQNRRQLIKVRNSLLPLVHLGELFGQTAEPPPPEQSTVVVIEDNGRSIGLMVDELLGKQEVVIKSLGETFQGVRGVAGGAILGDGRVGLILDAGGLVALMEEPLGRAA